MIILLIFFDASDLIFKLTGHLLRIFWIIGHFYSNFMRKHFVFSEKINAYFVE